MHGSGILRHPEQKLDPPFILFPKAHQVDGEWVIHIQVPSSSLVHKTRNRVYDRSNDGDFIVQQPCTFVIHSDRVETENANNPHGEGPINPDSFSPFPKNPTIAKFFMQLGRVDELGSGVLKVNRFIRNYTGNGDVAPGFIEGNSFRVIIPLSEKIKQAKIEQATQVKDDIGRVNDIVSDRVKERITKTILLLDNNPGLRANQISKTLQVSVETVARDLRKAKGLIEYKGAPKTGGYFLTEQLTKNIRG